MEGLFFFASGLLEMVNLDLASLKMFLAESIEGG